MQKILWKIEELWGDERQEGFFIDFSNRYPRGISSTYNRFCYVDTFNPELSKSPVFSDDFGEYYGLAQLQLMPVSGKPVYVFDNHNEMIFPLYELYEILNESLQVLHIDAHPDDAPFPLEKRKEIAPFEVKEVIQETRISDFFDALSETNIIKDIQRVCDSQSFSHFKKPEYPYVLSLDIDIFGPEGDFVDLETKVKVIKEAWHGAKAVCIATSPGFIDQGFAHEIVKILTLHEIYA